MGDFVDAPCRRAQDEGFTGAGFEDHLFVQLANTDAAAFAVGEEDAVEAAVGNGAGVEDGEAGCALAWGDDVADAVPGEARAELGELIGGVAAAEQVQNAFECCAGEAAEGGGRADDPVKIVDAGLRDVFEILCEGILV